MGRYNRAMRRFFVTLPIALTLFVSAALPVYAANLPLLDPNFSIVPKECSTCPCNYYGLLQLIQNLMNAGISIGIIAFVLVTAYAGASFMLNPTNPESRSKARSMLINVVVGMVILLTAWLVVDFVMKVLYDPNATLSGSEKFGPWNEILSSPDTKWCIEQKSPTAIGGVIGSIITRELAGSTGPQVLANGGSGSCNANEVQTAATAGGYRITAQQANVLACLARPESSCGLNTAGARTSDGKSTSASGPWQILLGANDTCHSLNIPACGNLNCSAAYSGGHVKSDAASQALAAQCQAAANNLTCGAAAAACIVQASGGSYSAWTGTGDGFSHQAQKACAGG
ncbi:MAG: hypothetical protein JWO84_121 [Parcubacteria group bacterium]|nr:hypothetical protein [Parcubacteria group bacterium]